MTFESLSDIGQISHLEKKLKQINTGFDCDLNESL